jgi:hypothetical protein
MEIPRHITFITNVDGYRVGDGLLVNSTVAAAYVAAGVAEYSENYKAPQSALEAELADHESRLAALE